MSVTSITRIVAIFALFSALASTPHAQETSSSVEKCSKNFGTLAVVEPQYGWGHLQHYGLGSPSALLRLMIQQSGCFDVVERGVAMQNLQQERSLGRAGDLRQESNIGRGQMQAADFVMTASQIQTLNRIVARDTRDVDADGSSPTGDVNMEEHSKLLKATYGAFCLRANSEIFPSCVPRNAATPGGLTTGQIADLQFIVARASPDTDADGSTPIIGDVDMNKYAQWLLANYDLNILTK